MKWVAYKEDAPLNKISSPKITYVVNDPCDPPTGSITITPSAPLMNQEYIIGDAK